jgi:hypothetical protein
MNTQEFRTFASVHWRNVIWVVWVVWGLIAMGLAHTEVVNWSWFSSFRFWAGQIVPTVAHPPAQEVMKPIIASSFLAILWATSPILWFGFRSMPAEKFFTRIDWTLPLSARVLLVVGLVTSCAIVALSYDWNSRRMANVLIAHPIGFSVMASLLAALPWYALAFLKAWLSKVNEKSLSKGKD